MRSSNKERRREARLEGRASHYKQMTITCPQCHHANSDDAEFCENCGAQLPVPVATNYTNPAAAAQASAPAPAGQLVCPHCKAPLVPGDEFCFNCGTDVRHLTTANGAGPVAVQPVAAVSQPSAGGSQPNNQMSDNDILRQLAELDGSAAPAPASVSAVGPAAQPAVMPPQPPPVPIPANTGGGSMPVPPGPAGGIDGNGFGAPGPVPAVHAPVAVRTEALSKTKTGEGNFQLHIAGPTGDQVVEWSDHEILLGRNDPKTRVFPDVNLDDSAASRRHLSIWKEDSDGFYYAQDLESANGTTLNGQELRPGEPTEIHDGDVMKIGTRYNIVVKIV